MQPVIPIHFRIAIFITIALFNYSSSIVIAQDYVPPIGIPAPEFGIEETVEKVYGSADYYTHWVDNSHPESTDSSNPKGSPEQPRKTVPAIMEAGSVVVIQGGPYTSSENISWEMNGTVDKPVFIRGVSESERPVFTKTRVNFNGQYFIVENIDFYEKATIRFNNQSKYGTLRHCEVHNPEGSSGASNPTVSATGEHIVVYNNEIHDNVKDADSDVHGVQASAGGNKIWVLDNLIYNNGGDGIQACHRCDPAPQYVYIGRNEFYGDKENGIDLKYAVDVIISENKIHGYLIPASTGIVSPIVIGSDGAPTRVWIIFNEIYNSQRGIRIEEVDNLWIIGNLIYDISGAGIIPEKKGTETYIAGNTLNNVGQAISEPWRDDFSFYVHNNIFANISGTSIDINSAIASKSEISHNLFWQAGTYGSNVVNADPLFSDADNTDFRLQAGSPAIDAGIDKGVYNIFQSMYDQNIKLDIKRGKRPQGTQWDIGAHEYDTGTSPVEYMLNIERSGMGNVSAPNGSYVEGSLIKLNAKPDDGWLFDSWSGDLSGTANPGVILMDNDKNITASFRMATDMQYELSTNSTGDGTITSIPSDSVYKDGTIVRLSAVPDEGWQFDNWSGDYEGDLSPVEINMDSHKSVTAHFSIQKKKIEELEIVFLDASDRTDAEHPPVHSIDNDFTTRWSAEGEQWIVYKIGSDYTISHVAVAWYLGNQRNTFFDLEVSGDSLNWVEIFSGKSSGKTFYGLQEIYDFKDTTAAYVRLNGHGNSVNDVNGLTELDIYGYSNQDLVSVEDHENFPRDFSLDNYPNPFNPSTVIRYQLPVNSDVRLEVYDVLGRRVGTLVNETQQPGTYLVDWDSSKFAGGTYVYRLVAGGRMLTNQMMLIK